MLKRLLDWRIFEVILIFWNVNLPIISYENDAGYSN